MTQSRLARRLRETGDSKLPLFLRVVAGLPLLFYGGLHLVEPDEFQALLNAAGEPFVPWMVVVLPLAEAVAGIVLLVGAWVRVGALLAVLAMIPALHTSLALAGGTGRPGMNLDLVPQAPPLVVPVVVLACALYVLVRGAGAFSADYRETRSPFGEKGEI